MKLNFTIERNGLVLRDALTLPDNHTLSEQEIEALKQERFERWYLMVTTPTPEYMVDETGAYVVDNEGNPIVVPSQD